MVASQPKLYYSSSTVDKLTMTSSANVFRLDLSPSSPTPIYRQIVDQVTHAVVSGVLRRGDELPSVRAVAQQHVVNPMTVSKAYTLLENQGTVERRRGLGMIVCAREASLLAERIALLQPALNHAVAVSRQLGITPKQAINAFKLALESLDKAPRDE